MAEREIKPIQRWVAISEGKRIGNAPPNFNSWPDCSAIALANWFRCFFSPKISGEGLNEENNIGKRNTPVLSSQNSQVVLFGRDFQVTLSVHQKERIGSKVRR